MCVSGKRIVCFPGRGYNVHVCEENIVCLSEKRILFYLSEKRKYFPNLTRGYRAFI